MEGLRNLSDKDFNEQLQYIFKKGISNKIIPSIEDFRLLMTYYQCAMMEIETKFNVLNQEFAMHNDRNPINSIQTRIKSGISIHEKLSRKGIEPSMERIEEELNDVAGIRVVCSFVKDVYNLEKALLAQDDIELIQKKIILNHQNLTGTEVYI